MNSIILYEYYLIMQSIFPTLPAFYMSMQKICKVWKCIFIFKEFYVKILFKMLV